MRALPSWVATASRSLSYFLGTAALVLATAVMLTAHEVPEISDWAYRMFGVTFLVLLAALVYGAFFCWTRLRLLGGRGPWLEAGLQAANGIATLALTYTLLGISLGIASMAEHELTPATVQSVIGDLTARFSLAFLTTVIGLPTSAALRALLTITASIQQGGPLPADSVPEGGMS